MKLPHTTYNGSQFTWTKNHGVTEASDLRATRGIPGSRIYDDACDYGFTVIGNHRNILFLYTEDLKSLDGEEIDGWKYISECGQYGITIIND